jgi:Zn finger protein HypA/HybF involved in hydrogenase expression
MSTTNVPDTTHADRELECRYCRLRMLPVTLGWHCPGCHATTGDPDRVMR